MMMMIIVGSYPFFMVSKIRVWMLETIKLITIIFLDNTHHLHMEMGDRRMTRGVWLVGINLATGVVFLENIKCGVLKTSSEFNLMFFSEHYELFPGSYYT